MRIYPPAVAAHLAARKPLLIHALIWLSARDRTTNAIEPLGLWTGADHQTVNAGGAGRVFHGVGALLGIEALTSAADMKVSDWTFQVSPLHAQVIEVLRVYEARLAPVEAYLWYWDPESHNPLADPVREFRGTIMEVDLPTPPQGGTAAASVRCVSDSWQLTRPLTLKRSSAALLARSPGDTFRQYNDISGSVPGVWAEKLASQPGGGSAPKPKPRPNWASTGGRGD